MWFSYHSVMGWKVWSWHVVTSYESLILTRSKRLPKVWFWHVVFPFQHSHLRTTASNNRVNNRSDLKLLIRLATPDPGIRPPPWRLAAPTRVRKSPFTAHTYCLVFTYILQSLIIFYNAKVYFAPRVWGVILKMHAVNGFCYFSGHVNLPTQSNNNPNIGATSSKGSISTQTGTKVWLCPIHTFYSCHFVYSACICRRHFMSYPYMFFFQAIASRPKPAAERRATNCSIPPSFRWTGIASSAKSNTETPSPRISSCSFTPGVTRWEFDTFWTRGFWTRGLWKFCTWSSWKGGD